VNDRKATPAKFETVNGVNIHRIPLEAYPGFWVYAYLLVNDEYKILIDCGSGTDVSHTNLMNGLAQIGLSPRNLTHILLTHAHIDHYGGLSMVKPLTDAKFGCHELDRQTVAEHDSHIETTKRNIASVLTGAGLAQDAIDPLLDIYGFMQSLYRSVQVDFEYESIGMKVGPLELVHLPGHCAGHVAMRVDDIVLCGDMVVEGVTPHINPGSIGSNSGLSLYLDSLQRLLSFASGAHLVLNGHDDAITNLPERVDATHKNLIRRMSKAIEALVEPMTIREAADYVYGESDGYQRLLIMEKTGAYIEYFLAEGLLSIINQTEVGQGIPAKYQRIRNIKDEELLSVHKVAGTA